MKMECLLCLRPKSNADNGIKMNSSSWDELNVQKIIEKHLWPMIIYKTDSTFVCLNCWEILDEFHKLYVHVESVHILDLKHNIMKEERDLNNSKDLPSNEELHEPEIVLSQSLNKEEDDVKQESNDSECNNVCINAIDDDDEDDFKDEDHIPLIQMKPICDNVLATDPIPDGEIASINEEDPLNKIKEKIVKKRRKRETSIWEVNTLSAKKTKMSKEKKILQQNLKYDSETTETTDCGPSRFLILKTNTKGTVEPPRYFFQTKMNLSDYDDFIAEHFRLTCHKCQETFKKFIDLDQHFKEVHKKKQCYIICCGTKFRDRSCLVDHINLHLNPEYFKCEQCPEIPKLRKTYKIHMRIHDKFFSCETCNEKFTSQYLANKHKLTHLPDDKKKFSCDECQKIFESEVLLNSHQRIIHLKKNTRLCEICGQSVLNSETFKRHMEKHEGIKNSLSCKICGRLVGSKRALKNHMDYMHPPEDNDVHVCHICQKISVNKRALKEHIRRVHSLGCNFKCTLCDKAFKRNDHLRDHMATHTGVGTSKCPWCPKVFNANSSMHLHRKKIHPKEWEEERRKRYSGNAPPQNPKPPLVNPSPMDNIPLMFSLTY